MKPFIHAKSSAAKFGGKLEDYLPIHDFMDSSKAALADVRHRAIFHSAFGIFIVERVFGTTIRNSDSRDISVRDIAEQHVIEDLGFIPTAEHWLRNMRIEPWMNRDRVMSKRAKTIPQEVPVEEFKEKISKMEGGLNPIPIVETDATKNIPITEDVYIDGGIEEYIRITKERVYD